MLGDFVAHVCGHNRRIKYRKVSKLYICVYNFDLRLWRMLPANGNQTISRAHAGGWLVGERNPEKLGKFMTVLAVSGHC